MADRTAFRAVKRRIADQGVKFRIGQVFRHKRYAYTAVVVGWDVKCDADEEWIWRNGVDHLDEGRGQAFYNAL